MEQTVFMNGGRAFETDFSNFQQRKRRWHRQKKLNYLYYTEIYILNFPLSYKNKVEEFQLQ
jgi:hypothetical protein